MFGFIAVLVSFVAVATDAGRVGGITAGNRSRAEKNGDVYYYDGRNKMRSTETGEICMMDYHGGQKLIGVKTGRVYKNYAAEKTEKFMRECNARFEADGVPIYYRWCTPYTDNHGNMKFIHLFEKKTDRPFKVLCQYARKGKYNLPDEEHFTIVYLNENNGMKSLNEYANIPSKWYLRYKMGI